nr:hypothetical protein [Marinicella sp. W31]MDC2876698.1 hypothetical protein [Marinicella sp. W31]
MIDWISVTRNHRTQPKPSLADPLESEDWRGHQWIANLISRLLRHR